jgi:adenylate cyclase
MADLIAQGEEPQQRWRRALPVGERVLLGRATGAWAVPWDPHISRQHAELFWNGEQLEVCQAERVRNPIFFRGQEAARFALRPGEHFVIGRTTFTLADQRAAVTADAPQPVQQEAYSPQYLKQLRFRNPDYRIEVLSRLPEAISGASSPGELCVRLVSMLLAGLPRADTAAVVAVEPSAGGETPVEGGRGKEAGPSIRVLHWDQRLLIEKDFQPSQRLILEAVRLGQTVLHVWQGKEQGTLQPFTARGHFDWAYCTPTAGEACRGWCLYVAGRFNVEVPGMPTSSDASDLREDIKFTELVASALDSLRQMQALARQHASLSQFFSPVVLNTLAIEDPEVVLAPRETEVSVLFCDLRGFSRESERHAGSLLELLNRVSKALGVMTHQILDQGGVVGDFQGDAAMGFWGWPLPQADAPLRTCRAALGIRREFEAAARNPHSPLARFRVGIGIATGRAVAGKIGTVDQVKVTVFGPVVNLASRLEGMTKVLRAPILLDQATAQAVRRTVPPEVARVRRLAVVRPYGMETPLEVSELLPPASEDPLLSDEHLATSEAALDAFLAGRWTRAYELLHRLPADDCVADFLTVYIAQHHRTPPPQWDGVIALSSK